MAEKQNSNKRLWWVWLSVVILYSYVGFDNLFLPEVINSFNWQIFMSIRLLLCVFILVGLVLFLYFYLKYVPNKKMKNVVIICLGVFLPFFLLLSPLAAYKDLRQGPRIYSGNCDLINSISGRAHGETLFIVVDSSRIGLHTTSKNFWDLATESWGGTCARKVSLKYLPNSKIVLVVYQ